VERDPLLPLQARIVERIDETYDTVTFHFELVDEQIRKEFRYKAGQFCEVSALGEGESTFVISGNPGSPERLTVSTKKVGGHTEALHHLHEGALLGFRGPYGKPFPVDEWHGKSVVIAGGGIGLAPLRPVIYHVINNRDKYDKLTILYGARSSNDLIFSEDLKNWEKAPNTELVVTVDPGDKNWDGREGFVPTVLKEMSPSATNAIAVTCGPPIMIKFTLPVFNEIGFEPDQIFTTLEMKMKCGLGQCGRCNIGPYYVCKDGPVFTQTQIQALPQEF
jgi:sulfhydrogenase subunit gamma (sulfur reductase)